MKAGEEIKCPNCGKDAFLVKKNILDGWTKKGEALACSACSFVICEIRKNEPADSSNQAKEKLKNLLQEEETISAKINVLPEEKHFCRDCLHFISHPFLSRCSLHSRNVEPMDDCKDFKPKNLKNDI